MEIEGKHVSAGAMVVVSAVGVAVVDTVFSFSSLSLVVVILLLPFPSFATEAEAEVDSPVLVDLGFLGWKNACMVSNQPPRVETQWKAEKKAKGQQNLPKNLDNA